MNSSTYLPTKSLLAVATALVCAAGFARADDNSLRRFSGDGYAYFSEKQAHPGNTCDQAGIDDGGYVGHTLRFESTHSVSDRIRFEAPDFKADFLGWS